MLDDEREPEEEKEDDDDDDEDDLTVSKMDQNRVLSLCGHILAEEPDAPEPSPTDPKALQKLLLSYSVSASELNNNLLSDPTVVVILDDFMLPVQPALILLETRSKLRKATRHLIEASKENLTVGDVGHDALILAGTDSKAKHYSDVDPEAHAQNVLQELTDDFVQAFLASYVFAENKRIAIAQQAAMQAASRNSEKMEEDPENSEDKSMKSGPVTPLSTSKSRSARLSLPPWAGRRVSTWSVTSSKDGAFPASFGANARLDGAFTPEQLKIMKGVTDASLQSLRSTSVDNVDDSTHNVDAGIDESVHSKLETTSVALSDHTHESEISPYVTIATALAKAGITPNVLNEEEANGLGWRDSFADLIDTQSKLFHATFDKGSHADITRTLVELELEESCRPGRDSVTVQQMQRTYSQDSEEYQGIDIDNDTPDNRYSKAANKPDELMGTVDGNVDAVGDEIDRFNSNASSSKVHKISSENELSSPMAPIAEGLEGVEGVEGEGDTDREQLSLEDIPYEAICPEPAGGDFYDSDTDSYLSLSLEDGESRYGEGDTQERKFKYRKVLVPTQENLITLGLQDGENSVTFELEGWPSLYSQLFVWPEDAKIVVIDIEGAISVNHSSKGLLGGLLGSRSAIHSGVVSLLNNISKQGYHILYITNSTLNTSTKEYLAKVMAGAGSGSAKLPPGPIFQSPDSLVRAFGAERTDLFKAAALRGLKGLFTANHNPFYASFGTRTRDAVAFSRCGVPEGRIFLVNENGNIYSHNRAINKTFDELNGNIDEMFPAVIGKLGTSL
jgi:hypothetical protein